LPRLGADPAGGDVRVVPVTVGQGAAVTRQDRLATEHVALLAALRRVVVDGEGAQHRLRRRIPLREVGVPADEVGGLHLRPLHAGLDDGPLGVELEPEGAVALLDPAGGAVDTDPDRYGAVRGAGVEQGVPQLRGVLHRHVELPAELTDVGDPGGEHRGARDRDLAAGEEAEALVGDVVVGERGEDVARLGSPQADRSRPGR
jgi:hypothetical protein